MKNDPNYPIGMCKTSHVMASFLSRREQDLIDVFGQENSCGKSA